MEEIYWPHFDFVLVNVDLMVVHVSIIVNVDLMMVHVNFVLVNVELEKMLTRLMHEINVRIKEPHWDWGRQLVYALEELMGLLLHRILAEDKGILLVDNV